MASWFGFGKPDSEGTDPAADSAGPEATGDESLGGSWWESVKSTPAWLGDTFTDACAAVEKSFRGDENAAEFFTGPADALADTWGDFKQSVVPIYDSLDVSWMSLKVFFSKEFGEHIAAIPRVQYVSTAALPAGSGVGQAKFA